MAIRYAAMLVQASRKMSDRFVAVSGERPFRNKRKSSVHPKFNRTERWLGLKRHKATVSIYMQFKENS